MSEAYFSKIRLYGTVTVAVAIGSLLTWNHYHGGIPSHHILANKDLPEISNAWGAVLLPMLTWFLLYRVQRRIFRERDGHAELSATQQALYAFIISLAYGMVAAVFFSLGYSDMTGNMMLGIFGLALFFPVYRAECLLGFVIGMTFTFGTVLPTAIGSIMAIISFLLFRGVRPSILYLVSYIRKKP
jgi:hypothetical protein